MSKYLHYEGIMKRSVHCKNISDTDKHVHVDSDNFLVFLRGVGLSDSIILLRAGRHILETKKIREFNIII